MKHYLDNPTKYFTSYSQLIFFPGEYRLDKDLVFKDIINFTMIAINSCKIFCSSNASIIVLNVTEFELLNIGLVNCGKDHTAFFKKLKANSTKKAKHVQYDYLLKSSILLYKCRSVRIINVSISTNAYLGGLIAVNVKKRFEIDSVKIQVKCLGTNKLNHSIQGILLNYNTRGRKDKPNDKVILNNFIYKINGTCIHSSRYAIKVMLVQDRYSVSITINNTKFQSLNYTNALHILMLSCKFKETNSVQIKNSMISSNNGDFTNKMFYMHLFRPTCENNTNLKFKPLAAKQRSNLYFFNCKFMNNSNMQAMIYIMPASTSENSGYVHIQNSQFIGNRNIHFIEVKGEREIAPWQLSIFIHLFSTKISLNKHYDGSSLISITNGVLHLEKNLTFINNGYYENIIQLHLSTVMCNGYSIIASNHVRYIIKATSGSYLIMKVGSALRIINNTVHNIERQEHTIEGAVQPICPIQFFNPKLVYYDDYPQKIDVQISMLNNVHTVSKGLIGSDLTFSNCTWLAGSAFRFIDATVVYRAVFQMDHIVVDGDSTRRIPLSVCPCSNYSSSCYSPNLNSIYPGQTLHVSLIVRKESTKRQSHLITTLVADNEPTDNCSITESYQLSQTHFNHGCNNYSYTIWPSHEDITECKLFVGLMGTPEMFFVKIKQCPKGFTLQPIKRSCDCDPVLNNNYFSITSCDLDQQTIFRPANSWISCDTFNNSCSYVISLHCPFYYCLPLSSNLLLTNPDMQCQFKRSGTLCGHCQEGLSTVFGSSQCKRCSNLYLFIVVLFGIAGVLMVVGLFVFNITINSGSFNTYIFYSNMMSINYSSFCPNSDSFHCIILSLFNLDLGIETCFYYGMDDYSKIWLQLSFPFYLIIIATALIISSRYSPKIQRLTAHRSLQVLATLFLLSYTKTLLAVCQVLFAFSSIMYLPSERTRIVWSVDASMKILGIKFGILFIVCTIIFLVLLMCNAALLFPRTVLRIKFVNKFKPLFDPYFAPYKDKYSCWIGLQLLIRAIFYSLTAQFSQDLSTTSGIIILIILLCLHGILQPFKCSFNNIQESIILSNLLIVYAITALNNDRNQYSKWLAVKLLINAQLAYFIAYIIGHSINTIYGKTIRQRYGHRIFNIFTKRHHKSVKHFRKTYICEIPEVAYNYQEFQESLIGLDK